VNDRVVTKYQPMSLAALAGHLGAAENDKVRWKLVWERVLLPG
jgi:hypothetical protein